MRIFILSFILYPLSFAFAQSSYAPGDWTSYRDFRYARSVDCGTHNLFVATTGGILEYQLYKNKWYDPLTVGYGSNAAVEIEDPILLFFDDPQQKLWVATESSLLVYDRGLEQWRITDKDKWPQGSRVVNIGIGNNVLYIETVPAHYYSRFFTIDSPLPDPSWREWVTRYKGSRQFGGIMLDIDQAEPTEVRWRGLRSKVPLNSAEMGGTLGMLPANFPAIFPPDNYTWQADGTLLDEAFRPAPITDWIIDQRGNLWSTHWGAGVLHSDLRTLRGVFYQAGPAGNDIRSILVEEDGFWFGGLNNLDRTGISHANSDLITWDYVEQRDDSRIRTTDTFDMVGWQGALWFATNDGLLSYEEKKREWRRFDVQSNLYANEVRALATADSELWIGTVRGLLVMTPGREIWRITNSSIELSGVTELAISGDTVYVGTPNGLFKGSIHTREFTFGGLDPGLLNAPIGEIATFENEVWITTPDGVMRYLTNSGESKSWLAQDWLGSHEPTSVQVNNRFAWIGTIGGGFYRYRKETGEWINYTKQDGLVSNDIQTMRLDGYDLILGTNDGITRYWWNRPGQLR